MSQASSFITQSARRTVCYLADARSSHTAKWANHFSRKGYEVHVLSFEKPRGMSPAVHLHVLDSPTVSALRYFTTAKQVRRVLKSIRPDLLHAHYASGYGTLARLTGFRPYILSVWGSDVCEFPAKSPLHRMLIQQNLTSADRVCSTSHYMANYVRRYRSDVFITPFGIDCSRFKPGLAPTESSEIVVGTVKLLEKIYRVDDLIRTFALLVRRYGRSRKLRLVIAGEGSLEKRLQELSHALGVQHLTEFLGFVAQEDVPKILNRLSVFVALSEKESFGVAALEASACGVPVVVSGAGGFRETVQDQISGCVLDRHEPGLIAAAIAQLIDNEGRRKAMGAAGRQFVLKNYEWTENASRMERLYSSLLNMEPSATLLNW